VDYVRRELALGALIADDRKRSALASLPDARRAESGDG
jgi:hypothetical protein